MNLIARLLDKMRPLFEEDGRLSRLYPAYRALDTFMFSASLPAENTPLGRDPMDIKRYMSLVIVALLPPFFMSVYFFGWRILAMLIVSYVAGGIIEVLFAVIRKEEVNEGFLVTGFLFPLIMPPGAPLWAVAVGVMFGVTVGKEIFGGTGRNLFNPALVGRIFLALGYPALMSAGWTAPGNWPAGRLASAFTLHATDAVSSATPLVAIRSGAAPSTLALFLGHVRGSAGETSAVAILIGGFFLVAIGIANWRTIVAILVSFAGLNLILHAADPQSVRPVLFNLLSGGLLFGTFFMATDPVSGPMTANGKWWYGGIIGVVTLLIRSYSGYVEGVMFAILLGNVFAPLIDETIIRMRMRRRYASEE